MMIFQLLAIAIDEKLETKLDLEDGSSFLRAADVPAEDQSYIPNTQAEWLTTK